MGRVAAVLIGVAVLAATGCGERAEPVATATVVYPVHVRATYLDFPPKTVGGVGRMAALVDALGAPAEDASPDLVAAWASEPGGQVAEDAGTHGFVAPDDTLEQVTTSISDLALLIGAPERARPIVERIERARRDVARRVRGLPRVTVFVDLGYLATAGERTLIGDIVDEAGGTNIAGATPEPGPFDLHELAQRDPAVLIVSSESRTTLASLRAEPRTAGLHAVRSGRVVLVPADTLAPGARAGEGLQAVARALHPGAYR